MEACIYDAFTCCGYSCPGCDRSLSDDDREYFAELEGDFRREQEIFDRLEED
ncbi:MAG: hypothetical protein ACI4JB_07090 [Porcipelethomonas sp.]